MDWHLEKVPFPMRKDDIETMSIICSFTCRFSTSTTVDVNRHLVDAGEEPKSMSGGTYNLRIRYGHDYRFACVGLEQPCAWLVLISRHHLLRSEIGQIGRLDHFKDDA